MEVKEVEQQQQVTQEDQVQNNNQGGDNQPQVDPNLDVTINLKLFELDYIIRSLEEKPFKEVAGLVMKLIEQGRAQVAMKTSQTENNQQ